MSDQWLFFPCQMGEDRAFVCYDHGIRSSLDSVAPANLLKVRVAFKQPRPDGMYESDEFPKLKALEDELQALVGQHDSLYVGRITVAGHRHFFVYTPDSEEAWAPRVRALGTKHGRPLAFFVQPDPQQEAYWQELFPTDDDWQVIKDLGVLEALKERGDDGSASRPINHWAYFPSPEAAEQFSQWATEKGYTLVGSRAADEELRICVKFEHTGTVQLEEITSHTIALRRKASDLGGDYDGWETPVCKTEPQG